MSGSVACPSWSHKLANALVACVLAIWAPGGAPPSARERRGCLLCPADAQRANGAAGGSALAGSAALARSPCCAPSAD